MSIAAARMKLGPESDEQRVFTTQHSTGSNQKIAEHGLILLTEIGSTVHGVSDATTGDDIDEMGICIEPPSHVIGLNTFDQYEYRTQPVNHRSGPGDIDRTVYSLRKWARLATAGNPTVLMPLFTDPYTHVRFRDTFGEQLRQNRDLFLSRQAGRKFLGYLDGQRQRYLDPSRQDSKHASRPELIEQFGWDTKTGYHALRLAIQGIQLMSTGTIRLPMIDPDRTMLLDVRRGRYTKEQVTEDLDNHYIPMLKAATEDSELPDRCDQDRVNALLIEMYQRHWCTYPVALV